MNLYEDHKWTIRTMAAAKKIFFYADDPRGGDDGSFDQILDWKGIAEKCNPLFLFGDYSGIPKAWNNRLVFKTSPSKQHPNVAAFFFPVMINIHAKPIHECEYISGFQGSPTTHPCREQIMKLNPEFFYFNEKRLFWSYSEEEKPFLHKEYLSVLNNTQFPLCPRGRGLNSIRFFEALRLGKIPVLIADDTKLPLENRIKYNQFVIRVPESEVLNIENYILDWKNNNDIEQASKLALKTSLIYFSDPEKFIKISLKELPESF
jgi:hypothetical protein